MALLLVHGRNQQGKVQGSLKDLWVNSLRDGVVASGSKFSLADEDILFPYYGDLLIDSLSAPSGDDTRKSSGVYTELQAEFSEEYRRRAGLPASPGGQGRVNPDELTKGGAATAARMLDFALPFASDAVVALMKDVSGYLDRSDVRDPVQKLVKDSLVECAARSSERNQPLVVVGHSLGSVVLYDVLMAGFDAKVDLFVTIGSPLGSRTIFKRLQAYKTKALWPSPVDSWLNISDNRDLVAIRSTLGRSNLFEDAPKNSRADVLNLVDVDNVSRNHHGIAEYLRDPDVARSVNRLL